MQEKERRLSHLLFCYNTVCRLLDDHARIKRQTPTQVEKLRAWKRVRRALALDINQHMQTMSGKIQLSFSLNNDDYDRVVSYNERQRYGWHRAKDNDPLNKGADTPPTLSGNGS